MAVLGQSPLGPLAFGHVLNDALVAEHTAVSGTPHCSTEQAVHHGAILLAELHGKVAHRACTFHLLCEGLPVCGIGIDRTNWQALQLMSGVAKES